MSSSPESPVLRGTGASGIAAARFDVDLRTAVPAPPAVVQQARDAARTAGYAEGWAQGQRAARVAAEAAADQRAAENAAVDATRAALLQRAGAAVAGAVAELDARRLASAVEVTDAILAAAVDVAEAVLSYELATAPDAPLAAVRRAMAPVPDTGEVTIRLHPADHQALVGEGGSTYVVDHGRPVTLRVDAALSPGDAVAEYGVTTVDATIAGALARIREVLSA
ncbi:MAG TPA: FliH/SctL family protein [Pilimelia sp.]|nr:FliH/SctL family protein [Pilimelia sp.]